MTTTKDLEAELVQAYRRLRAPTAPGRHCFTFADAHEHGDSLPAMMRLRYRVFIEREEYEVPSYAGLEYDQFDTPAAHYTVWRDSSRCVRGCFRLIQVNEPFLMETLWPGLSFGPSTEWEVSRFAIDHTLPLAARQRCARELVLALVERAESLEIGSYLFLSHKRLIQNMLGADVEIQELGEPRLLGKRNVQALRVVLNQDVLDRTRERNL